MLRDLPSLYEFPKKEQLTTIKCENKGVTMSKEKIIAFCGIVCNECPAFIAKQTDNDELRKKTAEEWTSDEFPLEPKDINCGGCTTEGEVPSFCIICEVRTCGLEKGIQNCAYCADYPCENLEMPWDMSPKAKEVLDEIRRAL